METFSGGDHTTQTESTNATESTTAMSFKVGEREYDVDSASKKIEHADNYIAELKAKEAEYQQKVAALEAQVAQSTKLEDALSKLQTQQSTPSENTTQPVVEQVESQEEVVKRILQQREAEAAEVAKARAAEETFKEVSKTLAGVYGADHVDRVVKEKAEEIGIDFDMAINMAKDPKQSKVLLKLLDVDTTRQQAIPQGQVNTASIGSRKPEAPKVSGMSSVEMANYMKQLRQQQN